MTTYNPEWDDETWREENFSEELLHSSRYAGLRQPTAKELISAAQRFGVEGILESAVLLSQSDYRKVEDAIKKLIKGVKNGRRGR